MGETYDFKITEFSQGKKGLVVSRKALSKARGEMKAALGERLRVGDHLQGKVANSVISAHSWTWVTIEGLLHVSEIAHEHVNHPNEKLNMGDAIEFK